MKKQRTQLFIEKIMPVKMLNEQVQYENGGNPFKGLHRWYSRKPLSFSRASILASLLPADVTKAEFEQLLGIVPNGDTKLYKTTPSDVAKEKLHTLCEKIWGHRGDLGSGVRGLGEEKNLGCGNWGIGNEVTPNPKSQTLNPSSSNPKSQTLNPSSSNPKSQTLNPSSSNPKSQTLNPKTYIPTILDAFAGGGSIPFEAARYGLNVLASDLNPVAVVTMKAAMEYPLKFGAGLQVDIDKWVKWVGDEAETRLAEFFPNPNGETAQNYLWAHTVVCPCCESIVPLSPNWWLSKTSNYAGKGQARKITSDWYAVKPIPNPQQKRVDFELVKGAKGSGATIEYGGLGSGVRGLGSGVRDLGSGVRDSGAEVTPNPKSQTLNPSSPNPKSQTLNPSSPNPKSQTLNPSSPNPKSQTLNPSSPNPKSQTLTPKLLEYDPDTTVTIARGVGKCPNCSSVIEDDVIKAQAQAGKFGHQLYAVAYKRGKGSLEFRTPTEIDLAGVERAEEAIKDGWENLIPDVEVYAGLKTDELLRYGIDRWSKLFNPRQLLTLVTYVDIIQQAKAKIRAELGCGNWGSGSEKDLGSGVWGSGSEKDLGSGVWGSGSEKDLGSGVWGSGNEVTPNPKSQTLNPNSQLDRANAVITYLALVLDRCVDRNCRMSIWHTARASVERASTQHALNLTWNYPEINGSIGLWSSCADAFTSDYNALCTYLGAPSSSTNPTIPGLELAPKPQPPTPNPQFPKPQTLNPKPQFPKISQSSADSLFHIPDESVDAIITDPPYYGTIQYAELSDFFYVWMKRVLDDVYPELFYSELTDKDREAVANPSRFRNMGEKPEKLAQLDYEAKMLLAFNEYHRVLRPDGVMTVQFNHKDPGAWDVLANSLINGGFEITASWSVSTENPQNLHQAKKNSVASTVLLVCRKRDPEAGLAWWDDLRPQVVNIVEARAVEFEANDITGIDLYLSAFGPALNVFSSAYPILDSSGEPVRPEVAFAEARRAIANYRFRKLVQTDTAGFDPLTQWYLLAWDAFKAREFVFDEARQLALAIGGFNVEDLSKVYKLITSTGGNCKLLTPKERLKKRAFSIEESDFSSLYLVDALHALIAIYEEEHNPQLVRRFMQNTGLMESDALMKTMEIALKVFPTSTAEYAALVSLRLAMDEIKAKVIVEQLSLSYG